MQVYDFMQIEDNIFHETSLTLIMGEFKFYETSLTLIMGDFKSYVQSPPTNHYHHPKSDSKYRY